MRWILVFALCWSLESGSGNLQDRLTHRADHGWIVTILEIDRDIVLPSEKQLLAVLRIKPPGAKAVSLAFDRTEAAVFKVEGADGIIAWRSSWHLAPGEHERMVTRSGWPIHLRIPMGRGKDERLPAGRYILHTRLLLTPPLENRIAFQVR